MNNKDLRKQMWILRTFAHVYISLAMSATSPTSQAASPTPPTPAQHTRRTTPVQPVTLPIISNSRVPEPSCREKYEQDNNFCKNLDQIGDVSAPCYNYCEEHYAMGS